MTCVPIRDFILKNALRFQNFRNKSHLKITAYTVSYDRANLKQIRDFHLHTLLVFAGSFTYYNHEIYNKQCV